MSRIRLKHGGRPKALFGADGAIMAAATLAAAGMNVAATNAASKNQAKAITESAKTQAQSIKDQTTNNSNLQKESISFTRQQNQENRQQQQDIQTTLQMIAGQSNLNERMEASKVQLKLGGQSKRRSIKSQPFYGGADMSFRVTDGGGVIPIQIDGNGYGLYELFGNDHEHYHKTPGGKNKTGVGIKFSDGSVVEGEGNQNSNQGELMYVTPQDAVFISKHSIDGFNPTEAVKAGVHPIQAFNVQEIIKARKGLNDDGSNKAKDGKGLTYYDENKGHRVINREKIGRKIHSIVDPLIDPIRSLKYSKGSFGGGKTGGGGATEHMYNPTEYVEINDTTKTVIPVIQTFNDAFKNARKRGDKTFEFNGKIHTTEIGDNSKNNDAGNQRTRTILIPYEDTGKRKIPKRQANIKMYGGFNVLDPTNNLTQLPSNNTDIVAAGTALAVKPEQITSPVARYGTRRSLKCGGSRRKAAWGDYAGATYSTAGNVLGAGLMTIGNTIAARRLGKAYTQAGNILADAYSQMKGIDLDEIKREDYAAPHTLAVVRDPNTNINPQLERIRRNSEAERREINRGTMSSAARQQRLAGVNDRSLQRMSEQYSYKNNADEQIKQANAQRITEVAQANADRDIQANKDWTSQRLAVLQYNNDIENAKIAGIGQSRADALTQAAAIKSQALQSSLGAFGNAMANSGQSFANAYTAARKEKTDFSNTWVGLGDADKVDAAILRAEQTGDKSFVDALDAKYRNAIDEIGVEHFKKIQAWRDRTGNKSKFTDVPTAITTQVNRPTLGIPSLRFAGNNTISVKPRLSLR